MDDIADFMTDGALQDPPPLVDRPHVPLEEQASAGIGKLSGMVWRVGDGAKHLGPNEGMEIPTWSRLFQTRCGLGADDGPWMPCTDDDDVWCAACLRQGGIPHTMWEDIEAAEDG